MQNLTVKVPDNKLAFFLELIQHLGLEKVEDLGADNNNLIKDKNHYIEDETKVIPEWQRLLAIEELENIEKGNTVLEKWTEVKDSFNFKS